MSATGLEVFDRTIHTTNVWLGEIVEAIGPDRQLAWKALSSVLHCIRDRMPVELAAHLGAQLPLLVRGAYYDQFQPDKLPADFGHEGMIELVAAQMRDGRPTDPEEAIEAVFATLSRHIPAGQIEKVQHAMPEDIRRVWRRCEESVTPPPDSRAGARPA